MTITSDMSSLSILSYDHYISYPTSGVSYTP